MRQLATLTLAGALLLGTACTRAPSPRPPVVVDIEQARALLEHRFPGMSGVGAVVRPAPTIAEVEAASLEEMKKCGHCPQVPFGYAQDQWIAFKRQIRTGDTVIFFRNNEAMWRGLAGAEGYALIRQGQLIDSFLTSMS